MFRRFRTEPGLIGLDWAGFRDAGAPARRFAVDGYLRGRRTARRGGRAGAGRRGVVSYTAGPTTPEGVVLEIGIVLLRSGGGGASAARAQALLCDYLFHHSPAQRIQAGTHPENVAEQRALEKAGFQLEGVMRASEFRAGQWRDGYLYSRLRDDPSPWDPTPQV